MKRLIAIVAAAGTALAGLAGANPAGAASGGSSAATAGIAWTQCTDPTLAAFGGLCGFVAVPLDYAHPSGTKIKLAVSMIKHTTPTSQGVMLVNPGGPGGSGLTLSILGQFVPDNAGDSYDWIGFDPRGVGSSVPALSCLPDYFSPNRPDYVPTTAALERTWLARSRSYAQACGTNNGALLSHMKTIDAAKDMDSIRAALGASQINYYGFSYGTYLGQVYSTLFPQRMRRMVLDSNVNPLRIWYTANLDQDFAFNRNIKIWFGWLAKYDSVYHLGKTEQAVEALWYRQRAELRAAPAGGKVGPDEWTDIFLGAGYYQLTWLELADAFAGWVNDGDAATLIDEYESTDSPGDDNGYAVYNAVQCTDIQWPQSWAKWRRDNWRVHRAAPFETWGNAWYNAPCLYWPASAGQPVKINGKGIGSALLIGETLDAATPFTGNLVVRKLFPRSVLIGEPGGTTHAGSLFGNACVDDKIAAYLATGALPQRQSGNRPDVLCEPLPQPVPSSSTATATKAAAGAASRTGAGVGPAQRPLRLSVR